ncbi:MAG: hypothetical protein LBL82_01875, partial [Oscillospiraceae bacterium]|nr:hypothetical protein [Oscillospiraceae bacterium]
TALHRYPPCFASAKRRPLPRKTVKILDHNLARFSRRSNNLENTKKTRAKSPDLCGFRPWRLDCFLVNLVHGIEVDMAGVL